MEAPQNEMTAFDPSVVKSGGSGEFADYVKLPAEEPIAAYLADIKMRTERNNYVDESDPKAFVTYLYFWFVVTDGEGKGQRYRYRTTATLATKPKKSNYYALLETLGFDPANGITKSGETLVSGSSPVLGTPARIELSEPIGDKKLQFVNTVKKATATQKRVDVSKEVAPQDVPDGDIDLDGIFDTNDDTN